MTYTFSKTILTLAGLVGMAMDHAYANTTTPCDPKENNYLHCLYSNDKENNDRGNYIRLSILLPNGKELFDPSPYCFGYGWDGIMLFNDDIAKNMNKYFYLGQNTLSVKVCADKNCKQSQAIGQDVYNISANQDAKTYTITPATYNFSFAGIYPSIDCNKANQENGLFKAKNKNEFFNGKF